MPWRLEPSLRSPDAVSFHNLKSQNFKLSVSNPKSRYVVYVSVLSQTSNCQSLGRKNKHEILKTDRIVWRIFGGTASAPVGAVWREVLVVLLLVLLMLKLSLLLFILVLMWRDPRPDRQAQPAAAVERLLREVRGARAGVLLRVYIYIYIYISGGERLLCQV